MFYIGKLLDSLCYILICFTIDTFGIIFGKFQFHASHVFFSCIYLLHLKGQSLKTLADIKAVRDHPPQKKGWGQ